MNTHIWILLIGERLFQMKSYPPHVWFKDEFFKTHFSHRCFFFIRILGCQSPRRLVQYFWTAAVTDLFRIHQLRERPRGPYRRGLPSLKGPATTKLPKLLIFRGWFLPNISEKWWVGHHGCSKEIKTKNKTCEFHGHQRKFARLKSIRQEGWCCWECLRQQHQNHPTYHLSERPQLDGMWNLVPFLVPNQRVEVAGPRRCGLKDG